jgi:hypothetical protein
VVCCSPDCWLVVALLMVLAAEPCCSPVLYHRRYCRGLLQPRLLVSGQVLAVLLTALAAKDFLGQPCTAEDCCTRFCRGLLQPSTTDSCWYECTALGVLGRVTLQKVLPWSTAAQYCSTAVLQVPSTRCWRPERVCRSWYMRRRRRQLVHTHSTNSTLWASFDASSASCIFVELSRIGPLPQSMVNRWKQCRLRLLCQSDALEALRGSTESRWCPRTTAGGPRAERAAAGNCCLCCR